MKHVNDAAAREEYRQNALLALYVYMRWMPENRDYLSSGASGVVAINGGFEENYYLGAELLNYQCHLFVLRWRKDRFGKFAVSLLLAYDEANPVRTIHDIEELNGVLMVYLDSHRVRSIVGDILHDSRAKEN